MKPNTLPLGTPFKMTIIEPWELVTSVGSGPFNVTLMASKQDVTSGAVSILIKLQQSITTNSKTYDHLVGSPRHAGRSIEEVFNGKQVAFSFVMLTGDRTNSGDPFDLSWWRGGEALIADLEV